MTGFVQFRDRIEAVALKIGGMVEQADLRILRPEAVEMPGQPAQDVVRSRV